MGTLSQLNWHIVAAMLSGVVGVASLIPYITDMVRGDTRPNAVSFFLWTALEAIAFVAQLKAGASWSIVFVGVTVFNTAIITILALAGYGYRAYGKFDAWCAFFCVAALVLWQMSGNPVVAIAFAIVADFCAALPTIKKVWREPHSEHAFAWSLISISGALGVFSTEILNAANLAFPVYVVVANTLVFSLIFLGQTRKPSL